MDWLELRKEFEATTSGLSFHRIDYQWGAAGIYYQLTGGGSSNTTRRFEVLAEIGGSKLLELPDGTLRQEVVHIADPASRWYESLRYHSDAFEHSLIASQRGDAGEHLGNIYTGTVYHPAETSALQCLKFSIVPVGIVSPPEQRLGWLGRLNGALHKEAQQRGYLWLVLGTIVALALSAFAL